MTTELREDPSGKGRLALNFFFRQDPFPRPPDQSDHSGKKRNLQLGKSCQATLGTQTFGSQAPPSLPPPPPLSTSLGKG